MIMIMIMIIITIIIITIIFIYLFIHFNIYPGASNLAELVEMEPLLLKKDKKKSYVK